MAVQGDLSDVDECRASWIQQHRLSAGLHILVNSAGLTQELAFLDATPESYGGWFDLNIRGYFFCAQQALGHLLAAGHGSIVNITSIHARAPLPRHTV